MNLARLALCLTLLVSSQGFAQQPEEWTPYTPPSTPAEPPTPQLTAPPPPPPEVRPPAPPPELSPPPQAPGLSPPPPAPELSPPPQAPSQLSPQGELIPRSAVPDDQTGLRLVVTPWAGAVTGMMGLIAGLVPSAIISLPFCLHEHTFDDPGCAVAFTAGMAVSYSLGATLGVTFVGNRLGGHGDGVTTFLGAMAGAALGAGVGVATHNTGVLVLSLSLAPLIGAVLGYEASHNLALQEPGPEMQARSGFRVIPVVGTTGRGSILGGLGGRF
jgi:hypothetical protein